MNEINIEIAEKRYYRVLVLENLKFKLTSNHVYFLTSYNGSGKTTFFNCLINEVYYRGKILLYNNELTYLPENPSYPPFCKVIDFLKMYMHLDGKVDETEIDKYLLLFDIIKYKYYYFYTLSKGTRQKIFIIKMLLSKSKVLLFDEPLAGLDQKSRQIFCALIEKRQKADTIIVIATHFINEINLKNKIELKII